MRQRAVAQRLARWPFAILGCLLALAVLLGSVAARADEPKKDDVKKTDKKDDKLPAGFPTFEDWLKVIPMPTKPSEEQLKQYRKMYDVMLEQAKKGGPGVIPPVGIPPLGTPPLPPQGGFPGLVPGGFPGGIMEPRLGARIEPVSPVLAEHLDLPEAEGIVLLDVQKDSAAAKAGIKSRDILLELNGKKVPGDMAKFMTMLGGFKEDDEVEAVVLHKGKKETIKGLKVPKAGLLPLLPGTVPVPPGGLVPPGGKTPPPPPGGLRPPTDKTPPPGDK